MKPIHLFLCVLVCLAPLAAQGLSYDAYHTQYKQHVRIDNEKALDRLVKKNVHHVFRHFQEIVRTELLRGEVAAGSKQSLLDVWQRVFGSETLVRSERWMQALNMKKWATIDRGAKQLVIGYRHKATLQKEKNRNRQPYEKLIEDATKLARQFSMLGDAINAADSWALVQQTYGKIPQKTIDDRREAVLAAEMWLDERKKWDYTADASFKAYQSYVKGEKARIKDDVTKAAKRSNEGYGDDVRGAEAFLLPDADKSEIVVPLVFAIQKKPKDLDMTMQGGPIPMMWASVGVAAKGPTKFRWFTRTDLFMVRPGSTKFAVTLDGVETDLRKNKGTKASVSSKVKAPTKFALDEDGKVPYAMWFYVGGSQTTFQGMNQNLAPTKESATVYYKSAASWTATVEGVPITIYDDNSNGKLFEEDPFAHGLKDRTIGTDSSDEVGVPVYDAMQIGKGKIQPLSSWVKIGEKWFHIRERSGGVKLGVRATNPEYLKTGTIQMVWTGPKPAKPGVLIVQGVGDFADARYNISDGKPMEVPAGDYSLVFGRITQGKGGRMMTADIVGGKSERITVEAGKPAILTLGAPFKIDFKRSGVGTDVSINAHRIRVYGVAGELYTHLNGAVAAADVMVAKDDTGKRARAVAEFIAIPDPEMFNVIANRDPNLASHVGFFPMVKGNSKGDPTLKIKIKKGQKVGLTQKKNKLFGKLLPIWK